MALSAVTQKRALARLRSGSWPVLPIKDYCIMQNTPTYNDAIDKLLSLHSVADVIKTAERRKKINIVATATYLKRLGVQENDLDKLNAVHVAGTKGKGSTCAIVESLLRHSGCKTGFFSSPHLIEVRERIRINGKPLSKAMFTHYFFKIWNIFENDSYVEIPGIPRFPSFFKFLVVMAYLVFLEENVDVAIVEVGIGGRYDCTNVIQKPAVVGISHLGYDHTAILGNTIESIAWQKAGIMKPHIPVHTVQQFYKNSIPVLLEEAHSNKVNLNIVPPLSSYDNVPNVQSDNWSENISLALQLSKSWIDIMKSRNLHCLDNHPPVIYSNGISNRDKKVSNNTTNGAADTSNGVHSNIEVVASGFRISDCFKKGVEGYSWPGRHHVVYRDHVTFYLDGAHTPVSIKLCSKWFADNTAKRNSRKVLIANTTKSRSVSEFISYILKENSIDLILFCPNINSHVNIIKDCQWPEPMRSKLIKVARANAEDWNASMNSVPGFSFSSVEEGVNHILRLKGETDVLITGSLHLVGASIQVLHPTLLEDSEKDEITVNQVL